MQSRCARLSGRQMAEAGSTVSDPSGSSSKLLGTGVAINGDAVPILYASPTRVDFQCPVSAPGTGLSIIVETEQGTTQPIRTVVHSLAPGIFSADGSGSGQGAVTHAGNSNLAMVPNYRYAAQPAQTDDLLVVRATGIDGAFRIFVNIAGVEVTPDSVDLVPGQAGVSQVSFTVPKGASSGNPVALFLTGQLWDGTLMTSNTITIATDH